MQHKVSTHAGITQARSEKISTFNIRGPFAALLREFIDITRPPNRKQSQVTHHIATNCRTVSERPRRLASDKLIIAKEEFCQLIEQGICRQSDSNWAGPLHLVKRRMEHGGHAATSVG